MLHSPHRFAGQVLRPFVGRRTRLLLALAASFVLAGGSQAEEPTTWGVRLGYPADKRVVILHADDIGMCYEANHAAKHYLERGEIQSAAMMVPCPWFNEIAAWYREHPEQCCGLHLAMNSEWRVYRWPPVAGKDRVPGMVDGDGYLHRDTIQTALFASPAEIELEIRAQLKRARELGIRPSHIDTHMGTLYARPDFTAVYCRLAEEHRIPAMVIEPSPPIIEKFRKRGIPPNEELLTILRNYSLPKLDDFESVPEAASYDAKRDAFFQQVRGLRPGVTEIIFHPSTMSEGLKKITGSWQQRAWEAEMFSDPVVHKFLESEGIVFTNWREMMRRFDERLPAPPPPAE